MSGAKSRLLVVLAVIFLTFFHPKSKKGQRFMQRAVSATCGVCDLCCMPISRHNYNDSLSVSDCNCYTYPYSITGSRRHVAEQTQACSLPKGHRGCDGWFAATRNVAQPCKKRAQSVSLGRHSPMNMASTISAMHCKLKLSLRL